MVPPMRKSPSPSSFSIRMIQSKIRHWWTQSNNQALHISQDQLLQSCIQTPYVSTSFAGMNSVEFQRRGSQTRGMAESDHHNGTNNNNNINTNTTTTTGSTDDTAIPRLPFSVASSSGYNSNCCHSTPTNCNSHNHNGNGSMNQYHHHHHHDRRCYHTNFRHRSSQHHHHHHHWRGNNNNNMGQPHPTSISLPSAATTTHETTATTVIITHGFGSGLGFFYKNVDVLFDLYPQVERVVLVDWIGMGGSDRPPIYPQPQRRTATARPAHHPTSPTTTQQAVNFFIEPFHEWFEQSIIERRSPSLEKVTFGKENIVLVGHSLGGYLCGQYAIKYPQHLSKLVLASPVGFSYHHPTTTSTKPSNSDTRMHQTHQFSENLYSHHTGTQFHPDPSTIIPTIPTTTNSTPSQAEATNTDKRSNNPVVIPSMLVENDATTLSSATTSTKTNSVNGIDSNNSRNTNTIAAVLPSSTKSMIRILSTLWRSNVTPQQLIRICGATQGRANVYRKLRQKLSASPTTSCGSTTTTTTTTLPSSSEGLESKTSPLHLHTDHDIQLLADYLYHITVADPSGEFAMNALLEPTLVTKMVSTMPTAGNEDKVVSPPQFRTSDKTSRTTKTGTNPIPRNESAPSFLFPEEQQTKNLSIGLPTGTPTMLLSDPQAIQGNCGNNNYSVSATTKTYSAMGVSAREPLQELLAQTLDTSHGLQCVKVLYGSHDWMRPNEMIARQSLQQLHARTGIETSVNVVPNVGHHLYMESPIEFVKHIMN